MVCRILADLVVVMHLGFVIFAVLGAFLIWWRRWIAWLHLPAFLWAVWIELSGGICPLTHLEHWLRFKGGQDGQGGDFVATYLLPILYPVGLTRNMQYILAVIVLAANAAIYGSKYYHRKRK